MARVVVRRGERRRYEGVEPASDHRGKAQRDCARHLGRVGVWLRLRARARARARARVGGRDRVSTVRGACEPGGVTSKARARARARAWDRRVIG